MVEIIPAILTSDPDELASLLEKSLEAKRVQIDIIDGEFANNKTIDPSALNNNDAIIPIDFHLMVNGPIHWVEKCVTAGADRVIGHIEQMEDQEKFIDFVHERGVGSGLAIDLGTKVRQLDWRVLGRVDVVLVMSVKAGFGGHDFNKSALDVMLELAKLRDERSFSFKICDDGGVSLANIGDTHLIGVDEVAIGRKIFEGDVGDNIKKYQAKAHSID